MAESRRAAALNLSRSFSAASSAAAAAPVVMGTPPGPTGWRNDPDFASYSRHPESGRRSLHVLGEGTSGAGRSFGSTFDFEGSATLAWSARPDRAGAIGASVSRIQVVNSLRTTVRYRGSRRMVSIRVCVRCDALSGRAKTRETRKFCRETWPSCHLSRCLSLVFSVIRFFQPFGQAEETREMEVLENLVLERELREDPRKKKFHDEEKPRFPQPCFARAVLRNDNNEITRAFGGTPSPVST
jgi:hypothetical protein